MEFGFIIQMREKLFVKLFKSKKYYYLLIIIIKV